MNSFKVGDRVECIDDLEANLSKRGGLLKRGSLYTVTRCGAVFIEVDNDNIIWHPDRFKLITSAPQESGFKVGDKVECMNDRYDDSFKVGRLYTITDCGPGYVDVDDCTMGSSYVSNKFKLITPKPQTNFKVGDRVECINNHSTNSLKVGRSYTITQCGRGYVEVDNCALCSPDRFKIITPKPQISEFKIGDRVEIVDKMQNYSTYTRFLVDNNLSQRIIDEYIENYTTPSNGTLCNILYTKDSVAVIILDDKRIAIIGESGLKLVPFLHKSLIAKKYGTKVELRSGVVAEVVYLQGHADGAIVGRNSKGHNFIISLQKYDDKLKHYGSNKSDIVSIL